MSYQINYAQKGIYFAYFLEVLSGSSSLIKFAANVSLIILEAIAAFASSILNRSRIVWFVILRLDTYFKQQCW